MSALWFRGVFLHPISTGAIVPPAVRLNYQHEPHSLQAQQLCWWTQRPVHADWKVTVTPQQEEGWKIWLQKFPAYGNLSSTVLGNCCYVEVTEKLSISRETAKIRHLHLLMLLFTLPISNALNGCSGSCIAGKPGRLNAASWFPVCRWVKLCFYLLTIPS